MNITQVAKKIELLLNTYKQNGSLQKTHKYETRNKKLLNQPLVTTKNYHNSFLCETIQQYQTLPKELGDNRSFMDAQKGAKIFYTTVKILNINPNLIHS